MVKLRACDPNSTTTLVNERNVSNIYLNAQDQLMVENEIIQPLLITFLNSRLITI